MSGVIRGRSLPVGDLERRRRDGAGSAAWTLLITASVPAVAAFATVLGVGLARPLPAQIAILCALLLTTLPVLGLASPFRARAKVAPLAAGTWLWSICLLLATPLYFPDEQGAATRDGLAWVLGPLGEEHAATLSVAGSELLTAMLPTSTPLPTATAIAAEEPGTPRVARAVPIDEAPEVEDEPLRATGRVILPYDGAGRSMKVPVAIAGPSGELELTMLFDTGATLTTLSEGTLRELGLRVPRDAPVVTLQTANGQVEAPLVLVDSVRLGDEVVKWATVAVCSACAEGGVAGLLGLNVTGQFQVALDHEEREIDLTRRAPGDRHEDVSHWVQLDSTARVWTDRRIEVQVTAASRARAPMEGLSVEVACQSRSFALGLDPLAPGGSRTTEVALPRGTDCSEYRILLREGRWSGP